MGIFKKLFGKNEVKITPSTIPAPNEWGEPTRVILSIRVINYKDAEGNEQARISMDGIERMNVCLASFLTKGVSYAQEKYNEYKRGGKDEDMEPVKAETKRGGKR